MHRHLLICAVAVALVAPSVGAQQAPPAKPAAQTGKLPVRRVILYKNGIGYFEHLGRVRGAQTVSIDFTSAQLNDVLKSLTTLDLDGGRITGVSYDSLAPIDQRLGLIRLPLGEDPTRAKFLGALRGARVDVQTGAAIVTGRILSVERVSRRKADVTAEVDEISLITDGGELRTIELGPATAVRLRDADLAGQVSTYLDVLASRLDRDLRRMHIATTGQGDRNLFVSYVSEVPVWKTTYRVVLPSKPADKPLLQGWAIVDNTVGEDWDNVELSLVAGAPQSFIMAISQPQYTRRPVVPMPQQLLPGPQTHAPTLREDETAQARILEQVRASPRPPAGMGGGAGTGRGIVGGVVGGLPEAPPPMTADRMAESLRANEPAAQGQELGDLFEYRLKEPITIRKNQSALVPILSASVEAEKVSMYRAGSRVERPLRALWLTNSSALTLERGTFAVLDGDAFAGEGLIDPLKPGERRLLSYATDLGVVVAEKQEMQGRRVTRLRSERGVLVVHRDERDRRVYTVRNEDREPRVVVIEHAVRAGWTLDPAGPKPAETSTTAYRFRLPVASKQTATLDIAETHAGETAYSVDSLTDDQIKIILAGAANPALEEALRGIGAKKAEIAAIDRAIAVIQAQIDAIFKDQQRVRENMQALKGSAEEKQLVQRYVRELDEQETRITTLRAEQQKRQAEKEKVVRELTEMIEKIDIR